jgi:hypothetical protein
MDSDESFYFGNAPLDQICGTGWFVGQFVPAELGQRHQKAVELKWGTHLDGEKRHQPWAQGHATTISILLRGVLRVEFHSGSTFQVVTLKREGDYVIYGPKAVHSWEATGDTLVLTVRFPSVEAERPLVPGPG